MTASDTSRAEIERLFGQDLDELNALLAQYDPDAKEKLFSFEAARDWGERIMERLYTPLHTCVCDEWAYCERRKDSAFEDDVNLAASIADLILSIVGVYPATVVSAILVKKGLDVFCGCKRV